MGRIGFFVTADNPGADETELLARDRLAHELMYFSRGNPVVYYGDEQGFTGSGGDQVARQTMFASLVPEYQDDNEIGSDRTPAVDSFHTDSAMYQTIRGLAQLTEQRKALRNGAEQVRYASEGPGVFAFSRIGRAHQKEYVVALNNSESAARRACRRSSARDVPPGLRRRAADAEDRRRPRARRRACAGLSTVGLHVGRPDPAFQARSEDRARRARSPPRSRTAGCTCEAHVQGASFYEVTFQRRLGKHGTWKTIGVDDSAPYQVFDDVSLLQAGAQGGLPRGGAGQRRSPARLVGAQHGGPEDGGHGHLADRRRHGEQRRPRDRHRGGRPRAAAAVGGVPAQRGRRPVDQPGHRQLRAGVHGHRRRLRAAARHLGPLPRGAQRARRRAVDERAQHGDHRAAAARRWAR